MKKLILSFIMLYTIPCIAIAPTVFINLFSIGNGHELIISNKMKLQQLPSAFQPMALGKFGHILRYDKAYLYYNLPFFFQKFSTPAYSNLKHLKDATETIYQGSDWLLTSQITTINGIEYYITVDIMDYDYQGKTAVYCLTAMAYVDNQAFRIFTECLKENYQIASKAFMQILSVTAIK